MASPVRATPPPLFPDAASTRFTLSPPVVEVHHCPFCPTGLARGPLSALERCTACQLLLSCCEDCVRDDCPYRLPPVCSSCLDRSH